MRAGSLGIHSGARAPQACSDPPPPPPPCARPSRPCPQRRQPPQRPAAQRHVPVGAAAGRGRGRLGRRGGRRGLVHQVLLGEALAAGDAQLCHRHVRFCGRAGGRGRRGAGGPAAAEGWRAPAAEVAGRSTAASLDARMQQPLPAAPAPAAPSPLRAAAPTPPPRPTRLSAAPLLHARWTIPEDAPAGVYRIRHFGASKAAWAGVRQYSGASGQFVVARDEVGRTGVRAAGATGCNRLRSCHALPGSRPVPRASASGAGRAALLRRPMEQSSRCRVLPGRHSAPHWE
jgi:hypothetical protein